LAGAQLLSPDLPAAPADPRGAELHAGTPLDLRVVAGATDCAVDSEPPRAVVQLTDATGASREVTVPLDDGGFAARLHAADCFEQALRAQVAIEVLGVQEVPGPMLDVAVQLRRVGGSDAVRVTEINSNTIYSITATGPLPVLDGSGAASVTLRLDPSRCDVHALNESYRTSLIGLRVALGDRAARPFVLTPAPDVRHRLETFAVDTCLGGGN
jgi:hypothetical protein